LESRINSLGGGTKVFRVKLESKDNVLKISVGVKMWKLEKIIRQ